MISVTDFRGKTLSFDKPVERVVCLLESATSGIFMLRAEKSLVGISTNIYGSSVYRFYALLDDRIKQKILPTPGNWDFINIESVVALQPELVIVWASQSEAIEALESHHVQVYAVMLNSVDDLYKEVRDFGTLLNRPQRADSLIQYTKNRIRAVPRSITDLPVVYFMWSSGVFETAGVRSTVNNVLSAAGCINACFSEQEHVSINAETLIHWDPEIIVMWTNDVLSPSDVMAMPSLRTLRAVRSKKVFELPEVFECDLWTLKFHYAVQYIHEAAYRSSFTTESMQCARDSMMLYLYGRATE